MSRNYRVYVSNTETDYSNDVVFEANGYDHAAFLAGAEHVMRHIASSFTGLTMTALTGFDWDEFIPGALGVMRSYDVAADNE